MAKEAPDIPLSDLEGYSDVAAIHGGRPLYHFSYVHSFLYTDREDILGDTWRNVDLVLAELDPPRQKIGFRFHRVGEVDFSGYSQIMGLFIQSIKERGWAGLRYEIGDYEDGRIHLFCHSVTLYDPKTIG
jgi:hypothetical protein